MPQYFTKVSEAYQKPLKDVYRQSNHIDATSQILKTHTKDYIFTMQDLKLTLSNPNDSGVLDSVPPVTEALSI